MGRLPQQLECYCFDKGTKIHAFFISNNFISNAGLKLGKNQANVKQHPEAESSSMLSFKNNKTLSKK